MGSGCVMPVRCTLVYWLEWEADLANISKSDGILY